MKRSPVSPKQRPMDEKLTVRQNAFFMWLSLSIQWERESNIYNGNAVQINVEFWIHHTLFNEIWRTADSVVFTRVSCSFFYARLRFHAHCRGYKLDFANDSRDSEYEYMENEINEFLVWMLVFATALITKKARSMDNSGLTWEEVRLNELLV